MIQNTDIARRLGYLSISDTDLIDAYDLKGIPPEQVVIMCTGSQGEPLSALARIANGEHRTIQMDEGDTVIVSATPVPGNEKAVTRVINGLAKIGADVYDKNRARVHVSGHAGAEELKLVLSIVQPKAFMPVHGEATHLRAHARLAEATGVPTDNVFICENGESLELTSQGVVRGETVQSGIVFVDGLSERGGQRADRNARHHGRRRRFPRARGAGHREERARARYGKGRRPEGVEEGRTRRLAVPPVGTHENPSHGDCELARGLSYNGRMRPRGGACGRSIG